LNIASALRYTSRPNAEESRSNYSITAFQHMPHGREHLIVTSSDANASMKVWDIRNFGRRNPVPLSSTPVPELHRRTRNHGISSMVLSGDGARLYAVCRDATIYAYSANHLALGSVPEMSSKPARQRMLNEPINGLAPLYGFKHPSLRIGTFYVRAALRPARNDQCEMLAVGSADHEPILFPTDERHLARKERPHEDSDDDDEDEGEDLPVLPAPRMSLRSSASKPAAPTTTIPSSFTSLLAANSQLSSLPIHQRGTALVRGHTMEVTSLVWSVAGDLVTVSDDLTARCWRSDASKARELRTCGEGEGARWNSGWADVAAEWDAEEV
jgi:WD40 repeat protein